MLIYRRTSLLESSAQTLVNTVNCVGVMGKGLAQAFKAREPRMFDAYRDLCRAGQLEPGKLWLWRGAPNWVLNFSTKRDWRRPSRLEWIEAGLEKFVAAHAEQGIREVSFPLLGCGNGGLDWDDVRPIMERHLGALPIPVYIHDFSVDVGLPEHMETVARKLQAELSAERSFEAFMAGLHQAVDWSGPRLQQVRGEAPFSAVFDDGQLVIGDHGHDYAFEGDALRGIWVGLTNGIMRARKAASAAGGGGEALVSLLSMLPQVRAIEIALADRSHT